MSLTATVMLLALRGILVIRLKGESVRGFVRRLSRQKLGDWIGVENPTASQAGEEDQNGCKFSVHCVGVKIEILR